MNRIRTIAGWTIAQEIEIDMTITTPRGEKRPVVFNDHYYVYSNEDLGFNELSCSGGEGTQRWSLPNWLVMA